MSKTVLIITSWLITCFAATAVSLSTFDWTESLTSGHDFWETPAYEYTEVDNGVTMKSGSAVGWPIGYGKDRATHTGNLDHGAAFKFSHELDIDPGQYTMWVDGGMVRTDFVVESIDYAAGTHAMLIGENKVQGLLDGVVQWEITDSNQLDGLFETFNVLNTPSMNTAIDEILWYGQYNAPGNEADHVNWVQAIDNLVVSIPEPATTGLLGIAVAGLCIARKLHI